MSYRQGLTKEFVAALNDLHDRPEGAWWGQMLQDPDLFVAIRFNYLNVYYRGCSLAHIRFDQNEVVVRTHYKYLLKPRLKQEYVTARGGQYGLAEAWPTGLAQPFITSIGQISDLKAAAEPYAGGEKKFVGAIIKNHTNVVDVEIALTKTDEDAGITTAKRLDISALHRTDDFLTLKFYEAKLFSSKYLRAQEDAEVIGQMTTYTTLLRQYASDIRQGFLAACNNVLSLDGLHPSRKQMALEAQDRADQLEIDTRPYLVVVGIDGDQKAPGSTWSRHEEKLATALGRDRVIVRGDAKSVRLPAGTPAAVS